MSVEQGSREKEPNRTVSGEFPRPNEGAGMGKGSPSRGKASAGQTGPRGPAC